MAVHRPRVRGLDGPELPLPTWTAAQAEDWLGRWAMNLMLINVSTRSPPSASMATAISIRLEYSVTRWVKTSTSPFMSK